MRPLPSRSHSSPQTTPITPSYTITAAVTLGVSHSPSHESPSFQPASLHTGNLNDFFHHFPPEYPRPPFYTPTNEAPVQLEHQGDIYPEMDGALDVVATVLSRLPTHQSVVESAPTPPTFIVSRKSIGMVSPGNLFITTRPDATPDLPPLDESLARRPNVLSRSWRTYRQQAQARREQVVADRYHSTKADLIRRGKARRHVDSEKAATIWDVEQRILRMLHIAVRTSRQDVSSLEDIQAFRQSLAEEDLAASDWIAQSPMMENFIKQLPNPDARFPPLEVLIARMVFLGCRKHMAAVPPPPGLDADLCCILEMESKQEKEHAHQTPVETAAHAESSRPSPIGCTALSNNARGYTGGPARPTACTRSMSSVHRNAITSVPLPTNPFDSPVLLEEPPSPTSDSFLMSGGLGDITPIHLPSAAMDGVSPRSSLHLVRENPEISPGHYPDASSYVNDHRDVPLVAKDEKDVREWKERVDSHAPEHSSFGGALKKTVARMSSSIDRLRSKIFGSDDHDAQANDKYEADHDDGTEKASAGSNSGVLSPNASPKSISSPRP